MLAIISDIHGNLEALQAVLEDIDKRNINTVYCLGDVIGYGPNPCECIEIVQNHCAFTLLGDHESTILNKTYDHFGVNAKRAVEWTHDQLLLDDGQQKQRYTFLENLPQKMHKDNNLYIYSCPPNIYRGFVLPNDIYSQRKIKSIFMKFTNVCFYGQTHIPGVFSEEYQHHYAGDINNIFTLPCGEKKMINVGSVGQPRDGDNRACYAIFDGKTLQWIRVQYNYQKTMQKIKEIDRLSDFLAERLEIGR